MKYGVGIVSNQPLPRVVEQVKLAEDLGYESVWMIDSQLNCRELYVTLTACALATSRIKLAAGVTAPRTRHASVTAGAFATLHDIAPGRLILGMSVGNTLVNSIGAKRSTIASLEGYVEKVRGLLSGEEVEFGRGVRGGHFVPGGTHGDTDLFRGVGAEDYQVRGSGGGRCAAPLRGRAVSGQARIGAS